MMRGDPLLTASEMQCIDAAALAIGIDGYALMQAAGQACCREAQRLLAESDGSRVTVCAGPGNNGGDGAVVARLLGEVGVDVQLARVGRARAGSDAARAFGDWSGSALNVDEDSWPLLLTRLAASDLIVDALLGAGLSRPVDGVMSRLIDAMNEAPAAVLAVDLPSGLNGDTHRATGPVVQADTTVTFVRYKPAHLLYPGRELCGRLVLDDIGMPAGAIETIDATCVINSPAVWRDALVMPSADTHKYLRGHVLVRGGGVASGGAARLSAAAALGCGAGAVTIVCNGNATLVNACHLNAVMLMRADSAQEYADLLEDQRVSTLLLGPGNGRDSATRHCVEIALASGRNCVLDADALTSHDRDADALVRCMRAAHGNVILTPHAGEFERLFGASDESKLHRARHAAARSGAVVVFKGADTVVAAPDGRAAIACHAPPWLATAGAGDVLAGVTAGLLTQGAPAFEAAVAAVWLHGQSGRQLGYPLTAEELVPGVASVLNDMRLVDAPELPFNASRE